MTGPGAPQHYDAVIIGAGIAGSIAALELGKVGKRVLVLDSGPRAEAKRPAFQEKSLLAPIRLPESPYPPYSLDPSQEFAPRATAMGMAEWPTLDDADRAAQIAKVNRQSYLVYDEASELPFLSGYERLVGGTMWHWLGTCVRLVPNDFRTCSAYGWGLDWPLGYDELVPYYERAEAEIGVAGDVAEQGYCGITFRPGYKYPMPKIPSTYSDLLLGKGVEGFSWSGIPVSVVNTPQGRNSVFRDGRPACRGNNTCIPLCPIQAKYDATVTLRRAEATGNVTTLAQAVATRLGVDPVSGRISHVEYRCYQDDGSVSPVQRAEGTLVVVAAHAIETPRLLLLSRTNELPRGVANQSSDQVGRNLMDHTCYLAWGLMEDQPVFPNRGPRSSSGIEHLRDGPFRRHRAAFRVDIGNEGWGWADNDPFNLVCDLVEGSNSSQLNPNGEKLHGAALIERLNHYLTRMVRFCFLVEQTPEAENRITLSKHHHDGLRLPRPEVNYRVSDYTKRGFLNAESAANEIFGAAGVKPYTRFVNERGFPAFDATDEAGHNHRFNAYGAGHIMGTYRMGRKGVGVVDRDQRAWDHPNLFLLGSGVFPTVGTGNPTLTIAALAFLAADAMNKELG
jgi:choline dehydrogenase-like flavoprotein